MPIVASQGTAPPRRNAPRKSSAPAPAQTVAGKRDIREAALTEASDMISLGLLMAKQPADAGAVSQHGPNIAHELALIADSNEGVAAFLDRLTTVGPYAGLMKAALPLALQLAVNHKRLGPQFTGTMGIMDPKDLEDMVTLKAEKMKAELEAEMAKTRKEMAEVRAQLNGGTPNVSA